MNTQDEALQKNIRRTASVQALKKIHAIVAQERNTDAMTARLLHVFLLYGWWVLLFIAGAVANFMGVF